MGLLPQTYAKVFNKDPTSSSAVRTAAALAW